MAPFWSKCFVLGLLVSSLGGQLRRFSHSRSRLDLLKKIVQTTQEDGQEDSNNILNRIGERRNTNILDRVRQDRVRQRPNLSSGGHLKSSNLNIRRPFSPSLTRGSNRNGLSDNECEELKTENDILKQLVESVNKQKAQEAKVELSNAAILQDQLSQINQPSPLSILSEALKVSLGLAPTPPLPQSIPGVHDRGIRRVMPIPEPSTILETTSYETFLTSQVTKDISLRFQGRWKTTQVVDTVTETSLVTEVLTKVITATTPAPLPRQLHTVDHNQREQKRKERPRSNGRFRPNKLYQSPQVKIKEFRKPQRPNSTRPPSRQQSLDSFQSLKNYLRNIKQNQSVRQKESSSLSRARPHKNFTDKSNDQQETVVNHRVDSEDDGRAGLFGPKNLLKDKITHKISKSKDTTVTSATTSLPPEHPVQNADVKESAAVSTSVVTLFISGSVPGEYTTSLKTVTVDSAGSITRERRQAESQIRPTKTVRLDQDAMTESDSYSNFNLESSFEPVEPEAECGAYTVTVTVVETVGCY